MAKKPLSESLFNLQVRSTAADLGHTSLAYRHVKAALRKLCLDAVGGNAAAGGD